MAVTIIIGGPRPEMEDFCTALETVLLDGGEYSYLMKGADSDSRAYLVTKEE